MDPVTPSLASVFSRERASALWSKLEDDHPLSQLCSKFWGKNIEDEAEQWRKSHPTVDNPTDDIGPGCYALDLGIDKLTPSKLWVRQDYIRIYNYCSTRHAEGPSSAGEDPRSLVITGQPGIGKTVWLTYAARRRLGEGNPFLWYQSGMCFLFVKDGVFQRRVEDVSAGDFKPFLWAFIDTDENGSGVPKTLAIYDTKLYIIFISSLKRQQWRCLEKLTDNMVIFMNIWSLEEMHRAAKIHLTNEQQILVEDAFQKFGPIPRICIDYIQDQSKLLIYERNLEISLLRMAIGCSNHI